MPPSVTLVLGYLPDVDEGSPQARRLGLTRRCALVLPAYAYDEEGRHFDEALLFALLEAVLVSVEADRIAVVPHEGEAELIFEGWNDVQAWLQALPLEERAPFHQAALKNGETIRALVETTDYSAIGGPTPYHDSYTFSIYTEAPDPALVRRQALGVCLEHGAVLAEVISGEDAPRRSFGRRLRDFL